MRILSLVLVISLLFGCSSTEVKTSDRSYEHKSGKFEFPILLGSLKRSEIEKFDSAGGDIGVSYNSNEKLSLVVTIYAFPTPKNEAGKKYTLIEHFEGINQAILNSSPNTKTIKWPESLPMWSDEGVSGVLQAYDLGGNGKVVSLLQVYDYGDWALEFRSSYKAVESEEAIKKIKAIHKEFKWPK